MRHRKRSDPVQGEQPPRVLPTVWADWTPAPDGRTSQQLRLFFEAMDAVRAGELISAKDLAKMMYWVYEQATVERITEASESAE